MVVGDGEMMMLWEVGTQKKISVGVIISSKRRRRVEAFRIMYILSTLLR